MNFDDPGEFKDGFGRRIRDITVLTAWLPKNIAGSITIVRIGTEVIIRNIGA